MPVVQVIRQPQRLGPQLQIPHGSTGQPEPPSTDSTATSSGATPEHRGRWIPSIPKIRLVCGMARPAQAASGNGVRGGFPPEIVPTSDLEARLYTLKKSASTVPARVHSRSTMSTLDVPLIEAWPILHTTAAEDPAPRRSACDGGPGPAMLLNGLALSTGSGRAKALIHVDRPRTGCRRGLTVVARSSIAAGLRPNENPVNKSF